MRGKPGPARRIGVGVVVAVVGGRHFVAVAGAMSSRVGFLSGGNKCAMRFFLWSSSRSRVIYCSRRCEKPLAWCIGRVLVGVDRLLGFGGAFFLGFIGMSVGVAIFLSVREYFCRGIVVRFKFQVG